MTIMYTMTQINDTVKQMMQAGESVKDIRRHLDMEEPSTEQVYKLLCKLCDRFKTEHMEKHAQVCNVVHWSLFLGRSG